MLTFMEKAVDCSPSEKTSLTRLVILYNETVTCLF